MTRPATNAEQAKWNNFKEFYRRTLVPCVKRLQLATEVANAVQGWLNANDVERRVWTPADRKQVAGIFKRANKIGRIMAAVDGGRYQVRFSGNDIAVHAPPEMGPEEYMEDQGLGAFPIVVALVVGALIVSAIFATSRIIEANARSKELEISRRIIEVDREMAKAGGTTAQSWQLFKRQNTEKLKTAAKAAGSPGWISKLFGSSTASTMSTILIGGIILWAFTQLRKDRG